MTRNSQGENHLKGFILFPEFILVPSSLFADAGEFTADGKNFNQSVSYMMSVCDGMMKYTAVIREFLVSSGGEMEQKMKFDEDSTARAGDGK
jgi:hypothetical protein